VFHHLTYGDVDVAAIADARERAALEAQARRRCSRDVCHVQLAPPAAMRVVSKAAPLPACPVQPRGCFLHAQTWDA